MLQKPRCDLCSRNHPIKYCHKFQNMTPQQRRNFIDGKGYCLNCLAITHDRFWCESPNRCTICSLKHHTMVHQPRYSCDLSLEDDEAPLAPVSWLSEYQGDHIPPLVKLKLKHGPYILATFLLDQTSEVSFVTRQTANKFPGLCSTKPLEAMFEAAPTHPGKHQWTPLKLMIKTAVRFTLPNPVCDPFIKEHYGPLYPKAHSEFNICRNVDGVIGKNLLQRVLLKESRRPNEFMPREHKTIFGWVIYGTWNGCQCKSHGPGEC